MTTSVLRPIQMPEKSRRHPWRRNLLLATCCATLDNLATSAEAVTLRRGTILYEPGDRLTHCYFPMTCIISLVAVLEDGNSAEVALFGKESVVAFTGAVPDRQAFGRYLVVETGAAIKIGIHPLHRVAAVDTKLSATLTSYASALTRQTFQCVACSACHSAEARCCRWLLSVADRSGSALVQITHEGLSAILGVQRPTVSLIIQSLQSSQLLRQKRGCIEILDRSRLITRACECYHALRM